MLTVVLVSPDNYQLRATFRGIKVDKEAFIFTLGICRGTVSIHFQSLTSVPDADNSDNVDTGLHANGGRRYIDVTFDQDPNISFTFFLHLGFCAYFCRIAIVKRVNAVIYAVKVSHLIGPYAPARLFPAFLNANDAVLRILMGT